MGFLGKDAEIKIFGNKQVICFSVATSHKDKDGNKVTEWTSVSKELTPSCNFLVEMLKKGRQVLVQGAPSAEAYMGKNGQPHAQLRIYANHVEVCHDPNGTQKPQAETAMQSDDGLPF